MLKCGGGREAPGGVGEVGGPLILQGLTGQNGWLGFVLGETESPCDSSLLKVGSWTRKTASLRGDQPLRLH